MSKIRFEKVYEFLDANGYDITSFCGFLGIPKQRYHELEAGAEPDDTEVAAFCDCLGFHPNIMVEKE